jgi:hypothetical protein
MTFNLLTTTTAVNLTNILRVKLYSEVILKCASLFCIGPILPTLNDCKIDTWWPKISLLLHIKYALIERNTPAYFSKQNKAMYKYYFVQVPLLTNLLQWVIIYLGKKFYITNAGQCYKTFFVGDLRIFVLSYSVC